MKKMKSIIVGAALMALAVPSVASANVAVTDGVGTVGKGDVQTALGGINDATMQSMWDTGQVKFTAKTTEVGGFEWTCADGSTENYTVTEVKRSPLSVTAEMNKAGKLTSGWKLNSVKTDVAGEVISSETGGTFPFGTALCADHGGRISQVEFMAPSNSIAGGLMVNGIELPNTPVEVAPVA
jgi:hypothetical protein